MRKLIPHELKFDQTETHFKEYLDGRHSLADALRKSIDFTQGHFYTFLTEDADLSKIYKFEIGHILPPNPIEDIYVESLGKTFKGERINSIKEELSDFIYQKITNSSLSFLAEDLLRTPKDPHIDLYHKIGLSFRNEIFYLVTQENLTKELVVATLKKCSHWQFVSSLFDMNGIEFKNKKISKNDFLKICSNTRLIIIGAYDGEGYLIWEKNS